MTYWKVQIFKEKKTDEVKMKGKFFLRQISLFSFVYKNNCFGLNFISNVNILQIRKKTK